MRFPRHSSSPEPGYRTHAGRTSAGPQVSLPASAIPATFRRLRLPRPSSSSASELGSRTGVGRTSAWSPGSLIGGVLVATLTVVLVRAEQPHAPAGLGPDHTHPFRASAIQHVSAMLTIVVIGAGCRTCTPTPAESPASLSGVRSTAVLIIVMEAGQKHAPAGPRPDRTHPFQTSMMQRGIPFRRPRSQRCSPSWSSEPGRRTGAGASSGAWGSSSLEPGYGTRARRTSGARIPLGVCGSAVFVVGSDGFLGGMARHDIDLDRTRAH